MANQFFNTDLPRKIGVENEDIVVMKLYDVTIFGYFWGSEQGQRFAPHSPRHPELRKDSLDRKRDLVSVGGQTTCANSLHIRHRPPLTSCPFSIFHLLRPSSS